jgi:hypothetical protein
MHHDAELSSERAYASSDLLCLPLTSEGLALEVGGALEPSPPVLMPALRRLVVRLRARLARHAVA